MRPGKEEGNRVRKGEVARTRQVYTKVFEMNCHSRGVSRKTRILFAPKYSPLAGVAALPIWNFVPSFPDSIDAARVIV